MSLCCRRARASGEAVQPGHHDVQDHQIRRTIPHRSHCGFTVGSLQHLIVFAFQIEPENIADIRFIFGNENGLFHSGSSIRHGPGPDALRAIAFLQNSRSHSSGTFPVKPIIYDNPHPAQCGFG